MEGIIVALPFPPLPLPSLSFSAGKTNGIYQANSDSTAYGSEMCLLLEFDLMGQPCVLEG